MLDHPSDVIRVLVRYMDVFDPSTGSIVFVGRSRTRFGHPAFRGGLIAGIEERAELVRRLHRLHPRKRNVLCLWYMTSLPATDIARRVGVSRMHCYRLKRQALSEMAQTDEEMSAAASDRHEPRSTALGGGLARPVTGSVESAR